MWGRVGERERERETYHSLCGRGVDDGQCAVVGVHREVGEDGAAWVVARVDPLGPQRPRWVGVVRNDAPGARVHHKVERRRRRRRRGRAGTSPAGGAATLRHHAAAAGTSTSLCFLRLALAFVPHRYYAHDDCDDSPRATG